MNADEAIRRKSNTEKLREFFLAHALKWIDAVDLEPLGGRQAWRSRVSDLRRKLEREGQGTIVNQQFTRDRAVVSQYMYRPQKPIGRDATQPAPGLPLFDDGPWSRYKELERGR